MYPSPYQYIPNYYPQYTPYSIPIQLMQPSNPNSHLNSLSNRTNRLNSLPVHQKDAPGTEQPQQRPAITTIAKFISAQELMKEAQEDLKLPP